MVENQNNINQLIEKLDNLIKRQAQFSNEINVLRQEIFRLKHTEEEVNKTEKITTDFVIENKNQNSDFQAKKQVTIQAIKSQKKESSKPRISIEFEKFIGENLISKVGIVITIIGVAIGAKYSIDHHLISPLARIILGYLIGLGLLGIGFKLKQKYDSYSAVLVSGAMTILYFITFAAYDFYALIPQYIAFGLMVLFTVFTVAMAINYNKQLIAIIGLVGAYAVPFLLSDGSGKVIVLFTYMAIINIGILVIAFKKYWKLLYYISFALSWIIYLSWFSTQYTVTEHLVLARVFAAIFFVCFYSIFLAYKLIKNEKYQLLDVALILSNSFIFYGIGYVILNNHPVYNKLLGLFTFGNALVHCIVSVLIYKQKLGDRNLFYLVSGLVLIFITIAIPVQLHGNWITMLWTGEAALLFWIGRTKNIAFYEICSYPLMLLAFISISTDWMLNYNSQIDTVNTMIPLFNINFLTSLLLIISFGFINILNQNKNYIQAFDKQKSISKIMNFIIPALLLFIIYFSFRMEIANYFNRLLDNSIQNNKIIGQADYEAYINSDLLKFKTIWLINYSLLFLTLLSIVNIKKLKNSQLGYINLVLNAFMMLVFLLIGLYQLSELRDSYLQNSPSQFYQNGMLNIIVRYLAFAFVAALLYVCSIYIRQDFIKVKLNMAFDIMLYFSVLWIASSELINWMDIAHSSQSYKLGLSIFWGIYALLIIALGIWKKKKHLRIGAIALFTVTLLKLFLYDISYLDTISKTIVFVSLGILLLIISFLYNKYKNIISEEIDNNSKI
ncbi:MAG: DUF2339 domain-containing protein [Bacteroidetes bacterium]|nr:DUF2339 domain-containing protein [Bacteroidota bacterium]